MNAKQIEVGSRKWEVGTVTPRSAFRVPRFLKPQASSLKPAAAALCAFVLAIALPAAADVQTRVLGTWGGSVEAVFIDEAVDPYLAYVGSGKRLMILDVTDPANIVEVGAIDLGNLVLDVVVRDGYAYVCTFYEPSHFAVVDVSDPADPQLVWTWDVPYDGMRADEVDLYGDLAYVRGGSSGVDVEAFDISDPTNPVHLARVVFSICRENVIVGDLMYMVDDFKHVRIYDMAAPWLPTVVDNARMPLVGIVTLPGEEDSGTAIAVEGDYAYAGTAGSGGTFAVIDVSDPNSPNVVGEYDSAGVDDISVLGGVAAVADAGELVLLDVATDPTDPTVLATHATHGVIEGVNIIGTRLYARDLGEGLIIFDIASPANPVRLGNWHSPKYLRKMDKVGDLLYVSDGVNGFTVLDVADPLAPALVGVYQASEDSGRWGDNWGIEHRDERVYLSAGGGGVEVVDVSDPSAPFMLGAFPVPSGYWTVGMALDPDDPAIAHVGVQKSIGGLLLEFDISDPANILEVGFADLGSGPLTIDVSGDLAYMARWGSGGVLNITDVSNPALPSVLSDTWPGGIDLARDGTTLFLANEDSGSNGGLHVFDATDPAAPVEIGLWQPEAGSGNSYVYGVALQGHLVYVAALHYSTLYVLDVADPTTPLQLAEAFVPNPRHVLVDGRYAYITSSSQGLTILDIGLPGDADADLDLDLHDFAALQQCYGAGVSGSGVDFTADCLLADFDQDDDCDLDDFAAFATAMTGCDPPPTDPTGACCLPDGTCAGGVTEPDCTWYCGGVYQGDGTTCDTVTCPPTGACCLPYGSIVCEDWTEDACTRHGGTHYGDGTDCSEGWCPFGACCDPVDGTCTEKTPGACTATGGSYQGDGSECATTTCPYGRYSNEIDPMTSVALAGTGLSIADDLTLEGAGARDLTYLDLRVYGNGGGAFDVTVELWTDCPGEVGASVIAGTTFTWTAVPDDGYVYTLTVDPVSPAVTIPDTTWMVATFTTPESGWIIAEQAEIGTTQDLYARYNGATWTCTSTFTTHYAGLWANLQCVEDSGKSGDRDDAQPTLRMEALQTPASIQPVGGQP